MYSLRYLASLRQGYPFIQLQLIERQLIEFEDSARALRRNQHGTEINQQTETAQERQNVRGQHDYADRQPGDYVQNDE